MLGISNHTTQFLLEYKSKFFDDFIRAPKWSYFYPELDILVLVFEESSGIYRYKIGKDVSKRSFATIKSASEAALKNLYDRVNNLAFVLKTRNLGGKV
jgi:glutathionyl-hydroquinone reductase